jgi:hypothetical protein
VTRSWIDQGILHRLQLLQETGVISPLTVELTTVAVHRASELVGIRLTDETGAFLTTHLAMAIERSFRGEELAAIDIATNEVDGFAEAEPLAAELVALLASLGAQLPAYEQSMIGLHLAAAVRAVGEEEAH